MGPLNRILKTKNNKATGTSCSFSMCKIFLGNVQTVNSPMKFVLPNCLVVSAVLLANGKLGPWFLLGKTQKKKKAMLKLKISYTALKRAPILRNCRVFV
ncbi:hypothetical protein GJAV_G00116570 [Gymnothorax javanicus]|nr:hypothetical protein GJAV_G00116570 [Gymnothorax javanicus]